MKTTQNKKYPSIYWGLSRALLLLCIFLSGLLDAQTTGPDTTNFAGGNGPLRYAITRPLWICDADSIVATVWDTVKGGGQTLGDRLIVTGANRKVLFNTALYNVTRSYTFTLSVSDLTIFFFLGTKYYTAEIHQTITDAYGNYFNDSVGVAGIKDKCYVDTVQTGMPVIQHDKILVRERYLDFEGRVIEYCNPCLDERTWQDGSRSVRKMYKGL